MLVNIFILNCPVKIVKQNFCNYIMKGYTKNFMFILLEKKYRTHSQKLLKMDIQSSNLLGKT